MKQRRMCWLGGRRTDDRMTERRTTDRKKGWRSADGSLEVPSKENLCRLKEVPYHRAANNGPVSASRQERNQQTFRLHHSQTSASTSASLSYGKKSKRGKVLSSNTVSAAYEGCFEETVRRRHFSISPGDYSPEITTTLTCRAACGTFDYQYAALAQAAYEGCFEETVRRRHFSISPGDYSPEITTTLTCRAACGTFDYQYAALAQGKFCFCGNSLPPTSAVSESLCDVECVAEPTQKCGGIKHVSVHTSSKMVAGLVLTSDAAGSVIPVATPVSIDVSVATGIDVIYQFDYDDGAGRTSSNVTDMLSRTYSIPGEYSIVVYANDVNQTFQDSVAATSVKVEAPPGVAEVQCDPVFATYEEGNECIYTVWSGTNMMVALTVGSFSYNFQVADPPLSLAGLAVPSKEALAGDASAQVYLLIGADFSVSGRVHGWELNVETLNSGTVTVAILKPACSDYCYGDNTCGSPSCFSSFSQSTQCTTGEQFCAQAAVCHSSCPTVSTRYESHSPLNGGSWEVVSTATLSASAPGYQYIPENTLVEIEPGYILGVQTGAGDAVLGRVTVGSDKPDVVYSGVQTFVVGDTFTSAGAVALTERHAIRAIASGGTKVHLPFVFTTAGNFTLTAQASSNVLSGSSPSVVTTVVRVEEGVNQAIITSPIYGTTGKPVLFEVEPHTGNNVRYNWTLSDGEDYLESSHQILSHTFAVRGTYQINVTVYNSVSFKSNTTDVIVEDEVLGLALTTEPTALGTAAVLNVSFSSGSDYVCTWDYGDGSTPENTDDEELTGLGFKKPHLYLSAATYTVTLTCANNVSSQTTTATAHVQELITNLRMTNEGANKGDDFYLRWEAYDTNKWQSDLQSGRPVSQIPLNLTASNLVSSETVTIDFQILTVIVNPTFSSPIVNASSGDSITFTADMDAGSDVTIAVDFRDGTSQSHVQTPGMEWSGPVTFTHEYHNGGTFDVQATFTNAEGSYPRTHTVTVLVSVNSIVCELPDFALYHPPAEANLTFIGEALPTDPELTINWGEVQSRTLQRTLALNTSYPHKFGDTGTFHVVATIKNLMATKVCNKSITIVEKLVDPHFQNAFSKAAVGLPFEVSFCLHRGPSLDECSLTFDFGDGTSRTVQRAGAGQDGCDRELVTYTTKTPKTITVTAVTQLEDASASITVDVIDGFQDSDISVADPAVVNFGSATDFDITYVGTSLPEPGSVSISIDFGDGSTADSGPHAFPISSRGDSKRISHTYTYDNTFTAQVTVFSDCCSVTRNVTAGVYRSFLNLDADLYYIADIPPNQITYGLEGKSLLYPTNKAVHFNMTDDNNAFASTYDITVDVGGNTILTCTKTTPEFSLLLNDSGVHTIDVQATNPADTANMPTKVITMYELIEGFQVQEGNTKVKMNEEKLFNISFSKLGTDTCLYVDFGDGMQHIYSDNWLDCTEPAYSLVNPSNKYALTGLSQISHAYSSEQYWEVTMLAKNDHSSTTQVIGFSISGLDCSKPTVSISNRHLYFTNPQVFKKSDVIRVRGLSEISCADNYQNTKSWRIEEMDPQQDTVIGPVSLTSVDISKAELNLPSRFLNLGLYRVYYKMEMDGSYGANKFEAEAYTYIKVEASNLIGIMLEGGVSEVERGQTQTLTLAPLDRSLDPDVDPSVAQGITVDSWICHEEDDDTTNCAGAGFTGTGDTQTLNVAGLTLDKTYKIAATLKKDEREIVTEVYLKVVSGVPPSTYIIPAEGSVFYQLSDGFKILQSSRLALDCICEDCPASENPTYYWEVFTQDYRWVGGWRQLNDEDMDERVFGISSKQISIQSTLFEIFNSPSMKVACTLTTSTGVGKVSTRLTVNAPPTPGTCSVSPRDRTITTETAWTLYVEGWSDVDGLDEFQFFIHTGDDTVDKQITSLQTSDGTFSLPASLSEGPDYNNFEQEIILKVRDTLEATSTVSCGMVVVRPMPVKDIRALARDIIDNQLHDLKRMFAEGDQKTCSERSTNIVSLLNSDKYAGQRVPSNYANSMYGEIDQDRPAYLQENPELIQVEIEYKMETERNDRALVRKELIVDMTSLEARSVIAIQQVSSFFAEAVVFGDEIDQESQEIVMNALGNMTQFLIDPDNIENVPSEDLEVAMENGIAAIGGIMDAAGSNGFFGTLSELEAATKDDDWAVYDTAIESIGENDDLNAAGTYEEALKIHTANIHRQRQARTAELVRNKIIATLDRQAQCFSRYSVPGQILNMNTRKMKVVMEKTDAKTLKGKSLSPPNSNGGVVLPDTTLFSSINADEPVVVSVSQSTNHPLKYSTIAQGIAPESNFISINIYNDDNTKIPINNLAEPVKVVIPRDANMELPEYISMDPIIPSWTNLMNVVVELNRTQSAVFLDFKNLEGRQFLLVVKKGKVAYISKDSEIDSCDSVYLMPPSMTTGLEDDGFRYRFSLSNEDLGDFTGKLYVGIRELNSTEYDMDISRGCASVTRYDNGTNYFQGNFELRQYVSQCLALSDSQADWSTQGCRVGRETEPSATTCYCTHLTTFAGGWVVVPNTIDWSYVFANADFLSNPTIYITVIVTAVLYFIAAGYARYNDKKMAEQLGIAPLADNDPRDKYFYEIIVCTGMRRNAGTNSQVCFILSGEDDETDVRAFTDSKRKIFRRGQIDGFLMAVPRPLGYLNFMRVWHDNSGKGKFGSWYLNYVVVRDVQSDTKHVFVANRWLAVEEDDGQVDRVLPVAGKEQLADFSYQFGERSRKDLADGHLWFSVVARPPQSRFTCLQRVSCCLCLLYVTMLTNAMFYNTTGKEEGSNAFTFGPFSVSPEQITIGVISNLIVFPVNFLLIFLFRKSRPHHKRPSRIDRAIKEVHDSNKQTSINDVKPEVNSIFSVSKTPTIPNDPHRPDSAASRPATAMSGDSGQGLTAKKKKKFELPWYFTIIAWILLWIVTLGALAMVIFYGISFKDETCKKWISSMLVSFFMSVFITQPIKVFLFAIILSIIIKNPGEEKDEEEDDEELPHVDPDNELLHGGDVGYGAARPRKVGYKPPNPDVLEKLRQRRIKEIKMWGIVRE
ncbi:polycystic kidney disease 1-related protein, partial [Plakobranchus ocellatus]